jgi:uncharacterized lipoprotein YajG
MRLSGLCAFGVATTLLLTPAVAARNNPRIALAFRPTSIVGAATPANVPAGTSFALVVEDARTRSDAAYLGTRTDDEDREHELEATNDVVAFVDAALRQAAVGWGIQIAPTASQRLTIRIAMFELHEKNQAVGANYKATVRLTGQMALADGHSATVTVASDASRYGKKFSADNTNEVLSDALLEAFAGLVDDASLWKAGGAAPMAAAPVTDATAAPSLTPEELLREIQKLRGSGLANETIEAFLASKTLTRPLAADDMRHWKEANLPEAWLRTAMGLPVR